MAAEKFSVPVIDLENYLQVEKEKLAAAVTGIGCFRAINHGIPATLVAEMRATINSLLDFPIEVKFRNTDDIIKDSGYLPFSQNHTGMTQFTESFGIYDASLSQDVQSFCSQLNVTSAQREVICAYTSKLHELIVDVASKISDCLGVTGVSFKDWICLLRLNNYRFTEEAIGSISAVPHSDSGFLTVIQEDEKVGGFEIVGPTGNFVAIQPVPGTFFFNIGDMGKVWSNGRLHNIKHRVVCKEGLERFTNVFFILAPKDYMVEPQAEFINFEQPKHYGTINFIEYRNLRRSTMSLNAELLPLLPINEATMLK